MRIGNYKVTSLVTSRFSLDGGSMFGIIPKSMWEKKIAPDDDNRIPLVTRSLLIRGNGKIILVDTGNGDKWDSKMKAILDTDPSVVNIQASLGELSVKPDEITDVICSHLHFDHAGGNTSLNGETVIPTFPNAKYLFSPIELEAMQEQTDNPFDEYIRLVFEDSVLPVIESGQSVMMDNDFDLCRGINILPSPGHSPGHYCIELQSKNSQGIITGDIFHNPIQVNYPHWTTMFCDNKEQANETRIKLVDDLIDSETIILAAHFAGTTAGKIISESNNKKFILLD